jgi:hypothetical protein
MQHDSTEQPEALADIWHAAEQRRSQEIADWIKDLFASKGAEATTAPKSVSQGAPLRA